MSKRGCVPFIVWNNVIKKEGVANHEIHDETAPLFYYKCEGKLQKRVHMLPVHPGVHMSETDVPQQADYSACCGQMSIGQGEHRMYRKQ